MSWLTTFLLHFFIAPIFSVVESMSGPSKLFEYATPASLGRASKDGLFAERLETFLEKSLLDIKAFAEREAQSYDETRRYVAQWHSKYLFQPKSSDPVVDTDRSSKIRPVLCDTSRILEALSETWGVHSFLLAVDPYDPSDAGFLGGSLIGREFWRGLRSGGDTGARSFRTHCATQLQIQKKETKPSVSSHQTERPSPVPSDSKTKPSKSVKSELYEGVRNELRTVSGVRTAEMKWSNPERLDIYGVRLVGWPEAIPALNPSSLKSGHNRQLLEALQAGTLRFERLSTHQQLASDSKGSASENTSHENDAEDFSWAYDANGGQHSASPTASTSISEASQLQLLPPSNTEGVKGSSSRVPSVQALEGYGEGIWDLENSPLHQDTYNADHLWDEIFQEPPSSAPVDDQTWASTSYGNLDETGATSERPRKRQRSEECS